MQRRGAERLGRQKRAALDRRGRDPPHPVSPCVRIARQEHRSRLGYALIANP
jgi:hypothetical protein